MHAVALPHGSLHLGDALPLLQSLPDQSVDMLLTDPPYSSGGLWARDRTKTTTTKYTRRGGVTSTLGAFEGDNRDQVGLALWMHLWLSDCYRVLREGRVAALFTDWRQLPLIPAVLQSAGFIFRGIIPWDKGHARPQLGRFVAQAEYVVWASKGPIPKGDRIYPGLYRYSPPHASRRTHQTEKPVALLRDLMAICPAGGTVLDLFAGSGSTGIAALQTGRRFIGCEITPHYHAVAAANIQAATNAQERNAA